MAACTLVPHRSLNPDPETHRSWSRGGVALIVIACLAVEVVGGLVTSGSVASWYPALDKPTWTPPGWVFGPVWTALYLLMAVAASIVWLARDREEVCCPLTAFTVQLAANLLWSVLFFGMRSPLLAFLDLLLLWVVVGVSTAQFFTVSRLAGALMVPYFLWVSFAALLNGVIVAMAA